MNDPVYLLYLDSLESILVTVTDVSPNMRKTQQLIIPGGNSRESNGERLLGCLNIIRDSERIVKDCIDQLKRASRRIGRVL
jgi:hypothetical protein